MVLAGGGRNAAAVKEVRPDGHGVLHLAPEAADGGDAVPRPPRRPGPRHPRPLTRAPARRARHPPPLAAARATGTLVRSRRGAACPPGHAAQLHPGPAPGERRDGRRRRWRRLGLLAANLGHGARRRGTGREAIRCRPPRTHGHGTAGTNEREEAEARRDATRPRTPALDFWPLRLPSPQFTRVAASPSLSGAPEQRKPNRAAIFRRVKPPSAGARRGAIRKRARSPSLSHAGTPEEAPSGRPVLAPVAALHVEAERGTGRRLLVEGTTCWLDC
jgi:hypothetical protein